MQTKSLPRPAHLPKNEKRLRVIQLIASGLTPDQIAFVLKFRLKTLQVFYSRELQAIPTPPKPQPSRKSDQFLNPLPLPGGLIITGPNGERLPDSE